jgi:hypothetical protein
MVIGTLLLLPSHGKSSAGKKVPAEPDPWAMALPTACSTCTVTFSENSVSDGSNPEHVTVTGSVMATRPVRLGVPGLIVIASAADAVAAQTAKTAAAAGACDI